MERKQYTLNGKEAILYTITGDGIIFFPPSEVLEFFLDEINFLVLEEGGEVPDDTNFDHD